MLYPGDFNGDGKTDFLERDTGWNLYYATGKGYNVYPFSLSNSFSDIVVSDINRDGKSDIWQAINFISGSSTKSQHNIYYSIGEPPSGSGSFTGFELEQDTLSVSVETSYPARGWMPALGDFNGDGKLDFFSVQGTDGFFVYAHPGEEDLLMTSAVNGLGAETDFSYEKLNAGIVYSESSRYAFDTPGTPLG